MTNNQLKIIPPSEMNSLLDQISAGLGQQPALVTFGQRWRTTYQRFGQDLAGELAYRDAWLYFLAEIQPVVRKQFPPDSTEREAARKIEALFKAEAPPKRLNRHMLAQLRQRRLTKRAGRFQKPASSYEALPNFDRPIFIVCAPRAGSTLLFETLVHFAEVWTIGRESHDIEADIPELHPAARGYISNRLTEAEATSTVSQAVLSWFSHRLQNREGMLYLSQSFEQRPTTIRFLEKTPKNALRIPFLKAIFPEARFIFLYREPRQNISSMLEGWRSRRFVAYRDIPGWPYKEWSFLLVPGWKEMVDRPLVEIAAHQWRVANETIQTDLQKLPSDSWRQVDYDDLINQPRATIKQISHFIDFSWTAEIADRLAHPLPVSHMTVSTPAPEKWRKYERELAMVLPKLERI